MYKETYKCITTSSDEAEYVALNECVTEAKALRNWLRALGVDLPKSKIFCDSSAATAIVITAETRRTRHINVCYHNSREAIQNKDIALIKVRSDENIADIFTKSLCKEKFSKIVQRILE